MTEAQANATNACVDPDLETTLDGTLTKDQDNNDYELSLENPSPSQWGPSNTEVLHESGEIVVPAGKTARITVILPTGTTPSDVRVSTALVEGSFQAVAPSLRFQLSATDSNQLEICDDNSRSEQAHTWSFGVKVDGIWYDPQVKNLGTGG